MIKNLIVSQINKNKDLILHETREMNDFIKLLMKQRNTGVKWTREERLKLRYYLYRIAVYVPIILVFLLPFGTFLLPILAESLDRRKNRRIANDQNFQSL
jgi:hypothetical protein